MYIGISTFCKEVSALKNTTEKPVKSEGGKTKLSKKFFIWLIILLIIGFIGVLAIKNLGNIRAFRSATTMTREEIALETEKNDKASKEILESLTDRPMHNLTDEERDMLNKGEITEEDAVNIILGVGSPVKKSSDKKEESKQEVKSNEENESEEPSESEVSLKDEIIARLYCLQSEYTGRIEAVIAMGKSEAASIQGAERNLNRKIEFIDKYMGLGSSMESGCDAKVDGLLSQLKNELEKNGEDTGVVGKIRAYYEKEKELKKAEIYNRYISK